MNYSVVMFASIALLLLVATAWLTFAGMRRGPAGVRNGRPEQDRLHISHLRQIKQALSDSDFRYLDDQGYPALAKRIRKERRRIALGYLACLRGEFEKVLHLARMVAAMSPNVAIAQEVHGLRLNFEFSRHYYWIYFRLISGLAPQEAIGNLSNMVSALTVRMEEAMAQLGERAVLGAALSPHNSGGLDAGG